MDTPSLNLSNTRSPHLDLCFWEELILVSESERTSLGTSIFLTFQVLKNGKKTWIDMGVAAFSFLLSHFLTLDSDHIIMTLRNTIDSQSRQLDYLAGKTTRALL